MSTTEKQKPASNLSPIGRISYPHLFTPNEYPKGKFTYSVTLLIPKTDPGIAKMKALAEAAAKAKFPAGVPFKFQSPFIDGDTERDLKKNPECAGCYCIKFSTNATNGRKPGVIGPDNQPLDPSKLYAGSYGRVSYVAFGYDNESKGVSFALNNFQWVRDGERLGAAVAAAEDEFDALVESSAENGDPVF